MTQIKEIDVVNSFYNLNISATYARDPDRIAKGLVDVLADFGLKIVEFGSEAYRNLKRRYSRVLDQIRDNKKRSKDPHYNFDSEKLFYCASDFPNLCEKDSPKR